MIINLAGVTFLPEEVKAALRAGEVRVGDAIQVEQLNSNTASYDADFCVYSNDIPIGWIPQLATIKKYMSNCIKEGQPEAHDMQLGRYKAAEKIRQQLTLDIHRNKVTPAGTVTRIEDYDGTPSISIYVEGVQA